MKKVLAGLTLLATCLLAQSADAQQAVSKGQASSPQAMPVVCLNPTTFVVETCGGGGGAGGAVQIVDGVGGVNRALVNASNQLSVNCANCTGSGVSQVDNTGYVAGTTNFVPVGGVFNDLITDCTSGNACGGRLTGKRGLHVNLRDSAGGELGTAGNPVRTDPTGVTTQPVSGTVSISGTVTVSGTVTANQGGAPWTMRIQDGAGAALATVTAGNAVKVDGSAVTQPISGTVTANAGTGTFTNQQTNVQLDYDTGAGTQNVTVWGLGLPAAGGAVAGGTSANPIRVDPTGTTTQPVAGTVNVGTFPANQPFNLAQVAGNTTLTGNGVTGLGSQRVTIASDNANAPGVGGSATGSAVPSAARYIAANSSGNLTGLIQCDSVAIINTATAGSTQLVALTAGQTIYVCGWNIYTSATSAVNVVLNYGTGAACGTGTTALSETIRFPAGVTGLQGKVDSFPFFKGMKTAASNALCVNLSAAVQVDGLVYYTKF